MRKKKGNIDRHLELSSKFLEMGHALMKEGKDKKDYAISQSGTFMIMIGGLMLDEDDIQQFGQLCSMFSAKKILDSMESSGNPINFNKIKGPNDESYEDFIKRINKLRDDKGLGPIQE